MQPVLMQLLLTQCLHTLASSSDSLIRTLTVAHSVTDRHTHTHTQCHTHRQTPPHPSVCSLLRFLPVSSSSLHPCSSSPSLSPSLPECKSPLLLCICRPDLLSCPSAVGPPTPPLSFSALLCVSQFFPTLNRRRIAIA